MTGSRLQSQFARLALVTVAMFGSLACSLLAPSPETTDDNAPGVPQQVADAGLPQVALSAPLDGAIYLEGVPVNVLARVTNAGDDVDRVEVLVDNEVVSTQSTPNPTGAPAFTVAQSWVAEGIGTHSISVVVFRADGTSAAAPIRVIQVISTDPNAMPIVEQNPDAAPDVGREGLVRRDDEGDITPEPPQPVEGLQPEESEANDVELPSPVPVEPTDIPAPTDPPTDAPTATPDRPIARVLVGVNVRQGPSTDFLVVGNFAPNTEVPALAVNPSGTWYKVEYYNSEGWVFGDLVEVSNVDQLPVEAGPPTPTPVPPTPTPVPVTDTPTPRNVNLVFDGPTGIDPYPPVCGETMQFTIRVRNEGSEGMERPAAVRIVDTHPDSGTRTETQASIPALGAGESTEITGIFLTVETNYDARHQIQIILDSNNEIQETNEDDNASRAGALEYTLERGDC